jgi:hypothetical protein
MVSAIEEGLAERKLAKDKQDKEDEEHEEAMAEDHADDLEKLVDDDLEETVAKKLIQKKEKEVPVVKIKGEDDDLPGAPKKIGPKKQIIKK